MRIKIGVAALTAIACLHCSASDDGGSDEGTEENPGAGQGGAGVAGSPGVAGVGPASGGSGSFGGIGRGGTSSGSGGTSGGASGNTKGGNASTGGRASSGGAGNTAGSAGEGGGSTTGGRTGTGGATGTGGRAGTGGATGTGGRTGTGGATGTGGTTNGGGGSAGGAQPTLPTSTGSCPEFAEGEVTFSVGGTARKARLYIDGATATALDGPVVFYWYGTGGQPTQAQQGLGTAGIKRIKDAGGIVVAPVHNNGGTFPWIGGGDADYRLMDEVLACAQQKVGIDARRIHALGFSAGGIFTSQLSFARSSYIASVATYSGGSTGKAQDGNKFAAMILHGGSGDVVVQNFQSSSESYESTLTGRGQFAFICNHGGGHRIPTDAVPSVVQFFFDHPYGALPSPYANALPSGFPSYCAL